MERLLRAPECARNAAELLVAAVDAVAGLEVRSGVLERCDRALAPVVGALLDSCLGAPAGALPPPATAENAEAALVVVGAALRLEASTGQLHATQLRCLPAHLADELDGGAAAAAAAVAAAEEASAQSVGRAFATRLPLLKSLMLRDGSTAAGGGGGGALVQLQCAELLATALEAGGREVCAEIARVGLLEAAASLFFADDCNGGGRQDFLRHALLRSFTHALRSSERGLQHALVHGPPRLMPRPRAPRRPAPRRSGADAPLAPVPVRRRRPRPPADRRAHRRRARVARARASPPPRGRRRRRAPPAVGRLLSAYAGWAALQPLATAPLARLGAPAADDTDATVDDDDVEIASPKPKPSPAALDDDVEADVENLDPNTPPHSPTADAPKSRSPLSPSAAAPSANAEMGGFALPASVYTPPRSPMDTDAPPPRTPPPSSAVAPVSPSQPKLAPKGPPGGKNDLLIVVESSLRTAEDFTIDTPKPQLARRTNPGRAAKDNSPFGAAAIAASAARVAAAAGKPRVGTPRPHNGTPRRTAAAATTLATRRRPRRRRGRRGRSRRRRTTTPTRRCARPSRRSPSEEAGRRYSHPTRPTTTPRARCPERAAHRTLSHARPRRRGAARHDCRV